MKQSDATDELVERNIDRDKGSLYRYGDDPSYGEELTRAFLQQIEDEVVRRYIPSFLTREPALT